MGGIFIMLFRSISNFFGRTINIGITSGLNPEDKKYIRMGNMFSVMATLHLFSYFSLFLPYFGEARALFFVHFISGILALGTLVMNYYKKHLYAKLYFCIFTGYTVVIVNGLLVGLKNPYNAPYMVLFVIVPLFLFSKKEAGYKISIITLLSVSYTFLIIHGSFFDPIITLSDTFIEYFKIFTIAGLLIFMLTFSLYANFVITSSEELLTDERDKLQGTLGELRKSQTQLVASEKKSALMKIAAGIAHELNNPLNYILGGVSGSKRVYMDIQAVLNEILDANDEPDALELKKYFDEQFSMTEKYFQNINKGVQKSAAVIKELRGITGVDGEIDEEVSLLDLVKAALHLAQNESKEKAKYNKIKVMLKVPAVMILELNRNLYLQVLKNIFMNAIYHSSSSAEPEIRIQAEWDNNLSAIRLSINNNGDPIREEIEQKIFDGFVTTKDIGAGRGLGLFQSRSLLEYKGGAIELTDHGRKSGWVKFEVRIPVGAKSAEEAHA